MCLTDGMILHLLKHLNLLNIILASAVSAALCRPLRTTIRLTITCCVCCAQSPRRSQILSQLGLKFAVRVSSFAEDLAKAGRTPAQYVMDTSRHKALDVFALLRAEEAKASAASASTASASASTSSSTAAAPPPRPVDLVIGADTVVVLDSKHILEKPRDATHAREMLASLSGRTHHVLTGVTLVYAPHVRAAPTSTAATSAAADAKASLPTASSASTASSPAPFVESFYTSTEVTFAPLSSAMIDAYVASGEPMDKAGGYGIQALGGSFVSGLNGCYWNVVGFPLQAFCSQIETSLLACQNTTGTATSGPWADAVKVAAAAAASNAKPSSSK